MRLDDLPPGDQILATYRDNPAWRDYDDESLVDIVRSCLILDVVVTPVLTGAAFAVLVHRLATLEERTR